MQCHPISYVNFNRDYCYGWVFLAPSLIQWGSGSHSLGIVGFRNLTATIYIPPSQTHWAKYLGSVATKIAKYNFGFTSHKMMIVYYCRCFLHLLVFVFLQLFPSLRLPYSRPYPPPPSLLSNLTLYYVVYTKTEFAAKIDKFGLCAETHEVSQALHSLVSGICLLQTYVIVVCRCSVSVCTRVCVLESKCI